MYLGLWLPLLMLLQREKVCALRMPFTQKLSQQLIDGKAIAIKGEITGPKFWFDLADGPYRSGSSTANYAISVSGRRTRRFRGWVINTRFHNQWQAEDRYRGNICNGRIIYVRIEPHQDHFLVSVRGRKIGKREYAIPLAKVSYVYVIGSLSLQEIRFEDKYHMVPVSSNIKNFGIGKSLQITGKPDIDARQFLFNFRKDCLNIPFHFNPRFTVKKVIRNAKSHGSWWHQETGGSFPFVKDEAFNITVTAYKYGGYDIYVNGEHFDKYESEYSMWYEYMHLEIEGDVKIGTIQWLD